MMNDNVNHPAHYCRAGLECIDAIEAATANLEGVEAVCIGNAIKYLWRYKEKNGEEDLKKARWYINRAIDHIEGAEKEEGETLTEAICREAGENQSRVLRIIADLMELQNSLYPPPEKTDDLKKLSSTLACLCYRLEDAAWRIRTLRAKIREDEHGKRK